MTTFKSQKSLQNNNLTSIEKQINQIKQNLQEIEENEEDYSPDNKAKIREKKTEIQIRISNQESSELAHQRTSQILLPYESPTSLNSLELDKCIDRLIDKYEGSSDDSSDIIDTSEDLSEAEEERERFAHLQ